MFFFPDLAALWTVSNVGCSVASPERSSSPGAASPPAPCHGFEPGSSGAHGKRAGTERRFPEEKRRWRGTPRHSTGCSGGAYRDGPLACRPLTSRHGTLAWPLSRVYRRCAGPQARSLAPPASRLGERCAPGGGEAPQPRRTPVRNAGDGAGRVPARTRPHQCPTGPIR